MSNYLQKAALVLLHLAALFALVSLDVNASGHSPVNAMGAVALAIVAIGMLQASKLSN